MAVLRILQYPDSRLKLTATPVADFGPDFQKIVDDMLETHYAQDNCAALAASQLDLINPPHVTVIDFSSNKNNPLCLVNAKIVEQRGETFEEEACMSVGDEERVGAKVKRAEWIKVESFDRLGKPQNFEADGFLAKCIQHELDHLHGILFIDHLSALKRDRLVKKLRKYNP